MRCIALVLGAQHGTLRNDLLVEDPLHNKTRVAESATTFWPSDFTYDPAARTCVCPAGKSLYRKGAQLATKGHVADRFQGAKRDCGPCPLRTQCLRTPEKTGTRQVAFFTGKTAERTDSHTARMQRRIDTPAEPVFGNLRFNKRLDRFTLRGRAKVDGQWKLFCLVQNIEKLPITGTRREQIGTNGRQYATKGEDASRVRGNTPVS